MNMNTATDKVIERVRKLLALSRSANEHEAGAAAVQAARLMDEHRLEEAALRVDSDAPAEPIGEETIDDRHSKKVHWMGTIAYALATTMGARHFWRGADIVLFGRPSTIRTVSYLYQYLTREVARLADERDGDRSWKNAFRVGAAQTIANRLYSEKGARRQATERKAATAPSESASRALAVVAKDDEEVGSAYEERSKGFRASRGGSVSNANGYHAGRSAGERIALAGARPSLGSAPGKLGRAS
jgi:hypothetical protein